MTRIRTNLLLTALLLTQAPTALASTTWYVNGVNGSDAYSCLASQLPCKSIGHAVSMAASGDSISIAAATYSEHLILNASLNLIGAGASVTIIEPGMQCCSSVVTIANGSSRVVLSNLTICCGRGNVWGAG